MARVLVAMSGGVDSSVVAALLVRQGHEAIGVTLQLRPCDDRFESRSCCSADAIVQARAVAGALGIRHYVLDCREAFEEKVLRPAWAEYATGRTPSPCLRCNREIKFGFLMDYADRLGARFLATGHYARLARDASGPILLRGADRAKDQSYFLSQLTREQLDRVLLPLGDLSKPEVRALARELGLVTAERHESQDACLALQGLGLAETLRLRFGAPIPEGDFIDPQGKVLGRHSGLHHYTIGQRRGLRIALGEPAHVVGLRASDGAVVLSTAPEDLLSTGLVASDVQWIAPMPRRCEAQIRSRHTAARCRLAQLPDGRYLVQFDGPQSAVAPGQAVAFYEGDRVLGGGWIAEAKQGNAKSPDHPMQP